MAEVDLTLLGTFRGRLASGRALTLPTRKAQALLAYLAIHPGRAHSRESLATLLWSEAGERESHQSLRKALSSIRKATRARVILVVTRDGVAVRPGAVSVDVPTFEGLTTRRSVAALTRAAELYRGELLEGLSVREEPFEAWLRGERQRLRELAVEALTRLVSTQSRRRALEPAIRTAVRLLSLDPLQERTHRELMRLYAKQGRRGTALKQYQACVAALQRELGVEPEPETKRVYHEILRGRPGEPTAPVTGPARATRKGLRGDTPLCGRDGELGALRRALDAVQHASGRVVTVLGEAGIGKSRLAGELIHAVIARGGQALLGRCYESEHVLPFGPWIDALRSGDAVALADVVRGLDPRWRVELARLLPDLRAPGLPVEAPRDLMALFEAVAQLISRLAARSVLLITIEDLHWADEISLRLLAFVARRLTASRTLLLVTAREEELDESPMLACTLEEIERQPSSVRLVLPPLSKSATATLVATLSPAGSRLAGQSNEIFRLSEGNPFVIVETVRALEQGAVAGTRSGLPLARRVQDLIAGRLRRLGAGARGLLAIAAVIGREFDFALLQRAAGVTPNRVAAAVEELVRKQVLRDVGDRFDFVHERIREVAYHDLLPPRRTLVHERVARALEQLHRASLEADSAAIGLHYHAAEAWDRAVAYLRRAGAYAFGRSANREAVELFERALDALRHLPESPHTLEQGIDLLFDLRNPLYQLGDLRRTLTFLREAERLTRTLDDPHRLGWLSLYMSAHLWLVGDTTEARAFAESARALADTLNDVSLAVWSRHYLGLAGFASGHHTEAEQHLRSIVAALGEDLGRERLGMAGFPSVISRGWLVRPLAERGAFDEAVTHGTEAVRIGEVLDHPYSLIFPCWHLAHLWSLRGEATRAIGFAQRGLALAAKWHLALLSPLVTWQLGYARTLAGDHAGGIALLEEALASIRSTGMDVFRAPVTAHLGEAYLLAGRIEDALAPADTAVALGRDHGHHGTEAWALRLRADVALAADPRETAQAQALYERALALAESLSMRPLVAHCHVGLAKISKCNGQRNESGDHFATATTMYHEMGMTYWLAKMEREVGEPIDRIGR